jgi:hypothetical protein
MAPEVFTREQDQRDKEDQDRDYKKAHVFCGSLSEKGLALTCFVAHRPTPASGRQR